MRRPSCPTMRAAVDIAPADLWPKPDSIGIMSAADWLVALAADRSRITAIGNATRERAEQQFDAEQVGDHFATMIRIIARIREDIEADVSQRWSAVEQRRRLAPAPRDRRS